MTLFYVQISFCGQKLAFYVYKLVGIDHKQLIYLYEHTKQHFVGVNSTLFAICGNNFTNYLYFLQTN